MSSLALVLAASVSGATLVLPAAPAAPGDLTVAPTGHGLVCTAAAPAASSSVLRSAAWTEHLPGWTEVVQDAWTEEVPGRVETVREAWTERVLATPAHTVEEEVSAAYDETVVDHAAWTETIEHAAETRTVEHPAVTQTWWHLVQKNGNGETWDPDRDAFPGEGWRVVGQEERVVTPAWTETVVDRAAWTETVQHPAQTHVVHHPAVTRTDEVPDEWRTVAHAAETVTHPARTIEHAAVTVDHAGRTITHPAVYDEVPGEQGPASCLAAADPGVVTVAATVGSPTALPAGPVGAAAVADPADPSSAVLAATGSDAAGLAAGAVGAVGLGLVVLGAAHLARHASRRPGDRRR